MGGEGRSAEPAGGKTSADAAKTDESRGSSKKASERASGEKLDRLAEKEREREKEKEKAKEKASGGKTAVVEKKDKLKPPPAESKPAARQSDSLPDEMLSMIAQAKFEAQEDKLKDVARFSLALIRDYPKLSAAEVAKKVTDVQKALLKYEMQCIRAWEYQERRRRLEITGLEEEAERCRQEAVTEGQRTIELCEVLEKDRRRRKRYEGYEESAAEVNRKRTRPDSKAAIASTTEEIAKLKQSSQDCDKLQEERTKRAHLLRSAVAELSADLQKEKDFASKVLGNGAAADAKVAAAPATDVVDVIM